MRGVKSRSRQRLITPPQRHVLARLRLAHRARLGLAVPDNDRYLGRHFARRDLVTFGLCDLPEIF